MSGRLTPQEIVNPISEFADHSRVGMVTHGTPAAPARTS